MQSLSTLVKLSAAYSSLFLASPVLCAQLPRCDGSSWQTPVEIKTAPDEPAYVGNPQIVPVTTGVAFIGGETALWRIGRDHEVTIQHGAPVTRPLAGVLGRHDGSFVPIPVPPETRIFLAPLAASGPRGTAHVVWGSTSDTSLRRFDHADTVWYAHFDGTRWSQPEMVTVATQPWTLRWNGVSPALLATADTLLLAVPADDRAGNHELLLLSSTRVGAWKRQRIPIAPLYEALVRANDGSLVLGYIAPAPQPRPQQGFVFDQNSVLVIRSTDGAATWSKPDLIHRSGRGAAHDVKVTEADGVLYLVWLQQAENESLPDSLLLAASTDNGRSWHRLPSVRIPKDIVNITAVTGGSGTMNIAGLDQIEDAIFTMAWVRGRWIAGPHLGPAGSRPTLALLSRDSLILTWSAPLAVGHQAIPVLMVSSSSGCRGN